MTRRAQENTLFIGSLILLVYLITSPVPERWSGTDRLAQFKEQTVSAATIVKVWANKKTGWYYCPDSKLYGKLKPGMYIMQDDALERGYLPAAHEPCR